MSRILLKPLISKTSAICGLSEQSAIRPPAGLHLFRGEQDDPQPGAANILQLGKIEQQALASGLDLLQQILLEGRASGAVETAFGPYLANIIRHGRQSSID